MKRLVTLITVSVLSFTLVSSALAQSQTIYGAYQDCPFHCRTIKINRNHTFEYRLNGDLYNDERYKGTWTLVDGNRLKATSPTDHSALRVVEKQRTKADHYSVLVLDPNGALVQGAIISGRVNHRAFSVTTGDAGAARIPKCRQFQLSFKDYRGNHRILNPWAREFLVMLTVDQMVNNAINETWLVEANRLYVAAEDGTFDRGHWLDKLSADEAHKIFR